MLQNIASFFEVTSELTPPIRSMSHQRRARNSPYHCTGAKASCKNSSGRKNDTLRYVDHIENQDLAMLAGALALGLEGIVANDGKSPYVEG